MPVGPSYPDHHLPGSQSNGKDAPNAALNGLGSGDDEISLGDIFDTLLKGKWVIAATFAAVLALVSLYTFTVSPEPVVCCIASHIPPPPASAMSVAF
jgi:LPS O-antigen subunit length determinant protein (WzzB/FepE family)